MTLDPKTKTRIEDLLGSAIVGARRISRGYTPTERWVVSPANGKSFFVKIGATPDTCRSVRSEREVYKRLRGRFMPELIAWNDDGIRPLLVLEDLSGYLWPPPWNGTRIESVLAALDELHRTGAKLDSFAALRKNLAPGWAQVEKDTAPFLSLGLASRQWLENSLPILTRFESRVKTEGFAPTHFDVRSDNICLTDRGAILVDWGGACLSNPKLDIGFWLPSLASEGGPPPEKLLPDAPEIAACVSGYFAAHAGLPQISDAPGVRAVQLDQLKPALAWAIRVLDLPDSRRSDRRQP